MWDPTVGLGTVTHEQIGYLWPLGPFFWLVHALGIPLWVGQRLWVGAMLFAAGTGVLYLCRTLGLEGPGRLVAAGGLHAVAVLPPRRQPHLGAAASVCGAGMDDRLRHPVGARRRVAISRPCSHWCG